jgi:acetylornithine deacetylase/succinyl-diaminopimelate desuccinylase
LTEAVFNAVPADEIEVLLMKLIEIESHDEVPGKEEKLARYIQQWFAEEGIDCRLQTAEQGRLNVIARLPGTGSGRSLLLNGHTDTVPGYGMASPFKPVKRDGRIYGRGAVDMKGALAAMMLTLAAIKRSGCQLKGDLLFAGTAGEESFSPGAWALARSGLKVDGAIVGEPTNMRVGVAHKGVAWYEAEFQGVPVHGSVPKQGVNAIYRAVRWIHHLLDRYIPSLDEMVHPLLGTPTLNIGMIEGGSRPVIVPGRCVVQFERRLLPGETAETVLEELRQTLDEVRAVHPDFDGAIRQMDNFHGVPHGPLESDAGGRLVRALVQAFKAEFDERADAGPVGLQYWTDGALLKALSEETVVCGPGDIRQAHSDDEFIEISQLRSAFRIYARTALAICSE